MSVQLTFILVTSMLLVKIPWAHTPVRVKLDLRGMKKTCYGKNVMKKMPVQSILALKFSKLCYYVKSLPNIYIFIRPQLHLNGAQT